MTSLTQRLRAYANTAGFNPVGIVPAGPASQAAAFEQWLDRGYQGEMGYLARADAVQQRIDARHRLPQARSLIVLGVSYAVSAPQPAELHDPAYGRFASYAWGLDYHDVLKPRLYALDTWLRAQTGRVTRGRVSVDSAPVLERSWAQDGGLGFVGKNTCLIHPQQGSWLFLATLLVPEELEYDTPPLATAGMPEAAPIQLRDALRSDDERTGAGEKWTPRGPSWRFASGETGTCGGCTRCLSGCPTQAFAAPYVLDARRCISYLTIELRGIIPRELRPAMGNWVFGCDVCQAVCPWNGRHAQVDGHATAALFRTDPNRAAVSLLDLLTVDAPGFRERFRGSPVKRVGRTRLVRNACVAAGNWADPQVLPALTACLHDAEPLVRAHAAWAMGRIDSRAARQGLQTALAAETDESVQSELALALAG